MSSVKCGNEPSAKAEIAAKELLSEPLEAGMSNVEAEID